MNFCVLGEHIAVRFRSVHRRRGNFGNVKRLQLVAEFGHERERGTVLLFGSVSFSLQGRDSRVMSVGLLPPEIAKFDSMIELVGRTMKFIT